MEVVPVAAIGYVACANGLVTISVVVVAVWKYDRLWLANPGLYCHKQINQ